MTLYDVLGVPPTATDAELRDAYRRLVRVHHPDRHAASSAEVRLGAEERMRAITHAWSELGDPMRRRRYDLSLREERHNHDTTAATIADDIPSTWEPYDTSDDIVDERLDDSGRPPPRGGRVLTMVPPVALVSGVILAVLGFVMGSRFAVAVGAMGVILGVALFLLASLSVVFESRQNDLR